MKYKMVTVEWGDAWSTDEWSNIDTLDGSPKMCYTTGWLVKKNVVYKKKRCISVASTVGEEGDACCIIHIPWGMIKKIRGVKG